MRRLLPLAVLAAVLVLAPSAPADTLFVLKGRGWGHGVGMSQWGAFGMAQGGSNYKQILAHYYRNTSFARLGNPKVGIELASGRRSFDIRGSKGFRVSAGGRNEVHPTGTADVKIRNGRIKVTGIKGTFQSPATFSPGTVPMHLGTKPYHGTFVVTIRGSRLRVVNRLRMEGYIRGVVPRESPAWWPAAALEAQAVAARSYAFYAHVRGAGKCGGAFCPDTRDQVYGGLGGEEASTNAAVAATARQVVVDEGGSVAQTFFHSSSGGRTANSEDVWSSSVSYLRSVRDRSDLVRANPNRRWTVLRTPRRLRSGLGLPCKPRDARAIRDSSDRVGAIRACGVTADGGDSLRWELDLRSNRFWLGVLRLGVSDRRIERGERTILAGLVRDVPRSSLSLRRAGGSWRRVRSVTGRFRVRIHPRVTTTYRLGPPAFGTRVQVRVEP